MTDLNPKSRARYKSGFVARYLRQFVLAKMDAEGWRQQQVAAWVGIPDYAMSEYLNRHTHPRAARRERLLRLGCEEPELARAEQLDKLEWWMSANGLSSEQVRNCLHEIQGYHHRLERQRADARLAV